MNFVSQESQCFPKTKSREILRLEGNKIHCSPRDQSLSYLLYHKNVFKAVFVTSCVIFESLPSISPAIASRDKSAKR